MHFASLKKPCCLSHPLLCLLSFVFHPLIPAWLPFHTLLHPQLTIFACRPQIRVQCANSFDAHGNAVSFFQNRYSKKLLRDFSGYFDAMFRSGMRESIENRAVYVDVTIEEFNRLYLCMQAGGPAPRNVIGNPAEAMTNLLHVYTLADRFQMLTVREWIHASILDALQLSSNWKDLYAVQVLQQPTLPGAVELHKNKIIDWAAFHLMQKELPREIRPISLNQFLDCFVEHCPGEALDDVWAELDDEFLLDLGRAMVRKNMMART